MGKPLEPDNRDHAERGSPRARHSNQLAASERYESLFHNAGDVILLVDLAGRIVEANEAATTVYGYSTEEMMLLSIFDLRAVSTTPSVTVQMSRADSKGTVFEAFHRRKDGTTFPVEVSSRGITLNGRRILLSIVRDVSVRKKTKSAQHRLLAQMETEFIELDRLKGQFITVAAHELKTPVAVMKGYAQLLLRSATGLTATQRGHLEAINRGSDRIDRIINELLEISKFQLGHVDLHLAPVPISELVARAVERFTRGTPTHHIVLKSTCDAAVLADGDRVERVVSKLLDNAVRYSPAGSDVEVNVTPHGGEAVVTVTDHGIGIPRDRQARIFELFYRAHSGTPWDYGGMGVGLYMSRETVAMHRGRMWFESDEGHGSSFHFTLPLGDRHG